MSPWGRLTAFALILAVAGCSSGDDSDGSRRTDEPTEASASDDDVGAVDGDVESDESVDQNQPADRLVLVRNLVTEPEADDAIALLADNDFDGFVKQPSSELLPTATEGWDVVRTGLTADEANQLVIAIATDLEVPYAGTIFVDEGAEDGADEAPSGDGGDDASGGPTVPSNTAVVTVGSQTWTFALSGDEGSCSVGGLRADNGVVGTGRALDASGTIDAAGALLTMNIYPEDWEPQGTQTNAIRVDAPGDDADWSTAGLLAADETGVPELAGAVVDAWTYEDGWATGTATFALESSLDEAQFSDGELATDTGSFEINCR